MINFSGFAQGNPLYQTKNENLHVKSEAYGYVEMIYNVLNQYINAKFIGKAGYYF